MSVSKMYVINENTDTSFTVSIKEGVIVGDYSELFIPYGETCYYIIGKEAFRNITDAIKQLNKSL